MSGFLSGLRAKVGAELKSLDATVPVKFSVDPASVAKARAALGPLAAGTTVPLKFVPDAGSVARARAALGPLAGDTVPVKFAVDKASLARAQGLARDALGLMPNGTIPLNFDLNQASLARAMAQFRTATGLLPGGRLPLYVDLNYPSLLRAKAAFEAATGITGLTTKLAAGERVAAAQAGVLAETDVVLAGASKAVTDALGSEAKAVATLAAAQKLLAGEAEGGGAGAAAGGAARGGFGRFGWLGATIGGVSLLHVAIDGVIEGIISIGLAATAAAIGLAAMAETADNVYIHLQATDTVVSAMNQHIAPLSGAFDKIQMSLVPQNLEVYGGALNLVNQNAGAVGQTARQVVTLFDDWTAKIDVWAKAQGGFGGLLHSGVGYLSQFGQIIGTVGKTLGNLLREDPGIAHYLLDIVGAAAKVFQLFTELPAPIVSAVLALHGIYLWGSVLTGVFGRMGTGIAHLVTGLAGLATNPLFWVGAAAAAVAYLAVQSNRATPAAQKFIGAINQRIDSEQASTAIGDISTAIGQLNDKIRSTNVSEELQNVWGGGFSFPKWGSQLAFDARAVFSDIGNAATASLGGNFIGGLENAGKAIHDLIFPGAGAGIAASEDIKAYNNAINSLLGDQRNLLHETGVLMTGTRGLSATQQAAAMSAKRQGAELDNVSHGGVSYAQALTLMNLAGVRANDSFALMEQKVKNLETGYENAGVRAGLLGNAVNAVTFATLQQQSKIGQLTAGWDAFFKTVTSGETGFVSFAQSLQSLDQAADKAHVSFTGLNANSLAARSSFLSAAQGAQSELDNLFTLSSAAGEGAKGTRLLGQATKDMLTSMLPAARNSKALTTVLYALAQQGGYHGADSFKALSQWVGNVQHPMKNLDGIVTTLTVHAGDLAKDVKNLSIALGQTLTGAEKQAIFYADGGQAAFNNYAEALKKNGIQSDVTRTKATALAAELIKVTGNTKDAHNEFDAMTIGMGYTRTEADKLWNSLVKTAESENKLHNKGFTVTGSGKGTYSIEQSGAPLTAAGKRAESQSLLFKAGGGRIPGYGGGDILPALLEPGETVIDKARSRIMAPLFQAFGVPGYAGGGIAGSYSGTLGQQSQFPPAFQDAMVAGMVSGLVGAMGTAAQSAAAAVSSAGVSGAHGHGSLGYLENLWQQAGGPGGYIAHIAGAIALAESGGNPAARNPSGASGLWQILGQVVPGNIFNPFVNALNAVKKFDDAGGFSPWVTYTSGAYRAFLDNGGILPPGMTSVYNGTGANEFVLRPDQLARVAQQGGKGNEYHVHTQQASISAIRAAFTGLEVRAATSARIGRNQ